MPRREGQDRLLAHRTNVTPLQCVPNASSQSLRLRPVFGGFEGLFRGLSTPHHRVFRLLSLEPDTETCRSPAAWAASPDMARRAEAAAAAAGLRTAVLTSAET